MSLDRLQALIKTKKCPIAVTIAPPAGSEAQAAGDFCRERIDSLRELVPALLFSALPFQAMGWQGMKALEEALACARESGLFTILDAPLPSLPADCVMAHAYRGGEALRPLLDACRAADKSLFLLVRTGDPGAGEIQELIAGDRLVYQAAGDLAQRLGKNDIGPLGYSRVGIVAETPYLSDLRAMRKRWEHSFLMVSAPPEDARYAFDKYGRGAILRLPPSQDSPDALQAAVRELRDQLRQAVAIL